MYGILTFKFKIIYEHFKDVLERKELPDFKISPWQTVLLIHSAQAFVLLAGLF